LESSLWENASRRIGPPPNREDVIWVKVGDRGADIFDHICECKKKRHRFNIRARQDRVLLTEDGKRAGKLLETVRATVAMKSVAALRLIVFRERTNLTPEAPAESSGLNQLELQVLQARTGRSIKTVAEASLAIGRLGGHLNRKSNGSPGWITLWRGWEILQTLVEVVLITHNLTNSG
jgi:hypothetical protein